MLNRDYRVLSFQFSLALLMAPALATAQAEEATAREGTTVREETGAPDNEAVIAEIAEGIEREPGGLTAAEVARRAVDTAPSVRSARASHRVALDAANEARASFVPNLTLTAGYTRLSEITLPPFEIPGLPPSDNPFPQVLDMFLFRATAAIPVSDYFLTILPAYEGTEGFADAASAQAELAEQQAAFRAREALYNYARAQSAVAITTLAVSTLEDTLVHIDALVGAGVLPRADGLQMRARVASARAGATQARGAARLTERVLRTMIHMPANEPLRLGEDLLAIPNAAFDSEQELVEEALARRPEARALRSLVRARQLLARAREGALYPRVLITAQADVANPNQRFFPQSEVFNATWAVGAALTWSPSSLPAQLHQLEQAHSQVSQARDDLSALEDGISIEATQALTQYASAQESIVSAREALMAAHGAFADRRRLLAAGVGTTTELAGAQLELTQAQLAFVDAHILLHLATASIERVAGRAGSTGGEH